jgi:hypothetical protein
LDHLVFGVSSLDAGARWLEERLGVALSAGGEHETMGTHNRLLRLGERLYLELIAIDPHGKKPDRPRWFALDALQIGNYLQTPRLLTWVAATSGLSRPGFCPSYDPGKVHPMSRNGFNWLITIRGDGSLPGHGLLPSLIEWPDDVHPAAGLPERGTSLKALELRAPDPDRVNPALESIGLDTAACRVSVLCDRTGPSLRACLDTPRGTVCFDSGGSAGDGIAAA